jgi:D-hydroxyproline dehydrogenase subunit alpha
LKPIFGARAIWADSSKKLLMVETQGRVRSISYGSLIVATGARELFLPFPGWTLPNVMGAGGLQALVKSGLRIESKRVVVAGTGPLLLAAAAYLKKCGAEIVLIAEQAVAREVLLFLAHLSQAPSKLLQAAQLKLMLGSTRYRFGTWVETAHGSRKVEGVRVRTANGARDVGCDFLAIGYGLVPNTELPLALGCEARPSGIEVDSYQRTSVANILCAGETTGIGGVDLCLSEGQIAGFAATGDLKSADKLFGERRRHRLFAKRLDHYFALRSELKRLASDDTFVCRCEDVPYGRLRDMPDWRTAKLQTRCGMGPCQGRICGAATRFLFEWGPDSVRPPIYPTPLGNLAATMHRGGS